MVTIFISHHKSIDNIKDGSELIGEVFLHGRKETRKEASMMIESNFKQHQRDKDIKDSKASVSEGMLPCRSKKDAFYEFY